MQPFLVPVACECEAGLIVVGDHDFACAQPHVTARGAVWTVEAERDVDDLDGDQLAYLAVTCPSEHARALALLTGASVSEAA